VLNPADSLDEGQQVRVKEIAQAGAAGAPAQAPPSPSKTPPPNGASGAKR
jgi:hypothetical protein